MKKESMNNIITTGRFNRLTGQETLHPSTGITVLSGGMFEERVGQSCFFCVLIPHNESQRSVNPVEMFKIPSVSEKQTTGYTEIFFYPDLLRCI